MDMLTPQKFSNSPKLYGFTLLKNGVKYDYSFRESLYSLLGIVDKIFMALDPGEDSTEEEIKKIPKVKIISSQWDMSLKGGLVLSQETNKALRALRAEHGGEENSWGIYLQADEVLHEDDYELLKKDIALANEKGFDSLSFRYLHFWQTHHHIAISKNWYPHEIRAIKLSSEIESHGDAQGFKGFSKVYFTEARIFHYGHVREVESYEKKIHDMGKMYHEDHALEKRLEKGKKKAQKVKSTLYFGTHPKTMKKRIEKMQDTWELEEVLEVVIVGDKKKYEPNLINSIKAKKISWYEKKSLVPKRLLKKMVVMEPSFFDRLRGEKLPEKMKSKEGREWSNDLKLILQLSAKRIGFRHKIYNL